jgi:Tfp pilus assembly protein PilZ
VERRADPRYEILAQIRVKRGTVNYVLEVRNISRSGMFVATGSLDRFPWFRVGQSVEVDLFILDELENLRLAGDIVRLVDSGPDDRQGFGVRFDELEAEARSVLDGLIFRAEQKSIVPPPFPAPGKR